MAVTKKATTKATTSTVTETKVETAKPKTFSQTDTILCRSVTPGWLGVPGKSGRIWRSFCIKK